MTALPQHATVIFDVDGVLLELTRDEEEIFFDALSRFVPTHNLSRDWNSYQIRNDESIITEILARNGLSAKLLPAVVAHYIALLEQALATGLQSRAVPGAQALLQALSPNTRLGIATANLKQAAALRLRQTGFWPLVEDHAQGADGGGHKTEILARLLQNQALPRHRIVYVGDNINDVEAGHNNNVHFIGFSQDSARRALLADHGAMHTCASHVETLQIIRMLLA